ncbi:2-octaprenyl-6-methoxyphenyl hydroxylase [Samsonia erythrinae]|uniref:2-octaprenyl-6-methoxyphenol hydroxylase /2-octaprenyl-3-methyl-6-methoxy-1,4-benzoquinol hydroxylase n=1 Tax=Samsonia erythrinae TaxID=160434 RepID=A0A4R3VQL1_9GAMM|nr:2-octaprenyl-6-methoxyphenyl hydroxylase [Samsonia erythrinae]TCV07632.1 2-octaprenyl-6-methoxyphenol hydroxylase /2-octaprenyl-3-methyl-6-methoxy-1,4-benzoquinol hydroxylase [Samsonia erythrinae]
MAVMIVGGGMAGATLALAISRLSQGTIPVELVEAYSPFDREHPGFDARAIALSDGTCQQLATLGIWQALSSGATAITDIHVSERGHASVVNLNASDYRVQALGYVVELHDIGQRLFSLLQHAPGVRLHCPAKVVAVTRTAEHATLMLDNGTALTGQLMVAADGSHSMLSQTCGIQWQQHDYHQIAVIANVTTAEPHRGRAFERFTPHGPLALLPMSNGRSSLVWCHDKQSQSEIDGWDESAFRQQLQRAFGWRLGRFTHIGERHRYPLRLLTASQHISHRLALVGNAAQTLHPIAGQGFNLGIRDVMSLAETVVDAAKNQQDIGQYRVLSRYQQRRAPDQNATIAITDGLVSLFANRYTALAVGRNLGLIAMNHLPLMRDAFARRTLGWVER